MSEENSDIGDEYRAHHDLDNLETYNMSNIDYDASQSISMIIDESDTQHEQILDTSTIELEHSYRVHKDEN
jgi:hypothetical protein